MAKNFLQIPIWKGCETLKAVNINSIEMYHLSIWKYFPLCRVALQAQDHNRAVKTPMFLKFLVPTFNTEIYSHFPLNPSSKIITYSWRLMSKYEGWPENIRPFWISREPVAWPWCNLAASQRRHYCASV